MQDGKRWITWKGRRILVNNKGNIINDSYKDNFKFIDDKDDGYDKYVEMSDKSYNKLTDQERWEIRQLYVGQEHSYELNDALRNDENSTNLLDEKNFNALVSLMDKACETYTTEEDMASTRFVDFDYLRNAYGLEIQRYGDIDRSKVAEQMNQFVGSELTSKSYTSISLNESGNGMFSNLAVKMKINLPKGTKMYVADNVSEYEAILKRNQPMILKKVDFQKSKIKGFENEYGKVLLTYEVKND